MDLKQAGIKILKKLKVDDIQEYASNSLLQRMIINMICYLLFLFNDLRYKVFVCFVDINGTVDHHCLNFPYIMMWYYHGTIASVYHKPM
jgi:hypothetical protein